MKKIFTIYKKLTLGFFIISLLIIVMGYLGIYAIIKVDHTSMSMEELDHAYTHIIKLQTIISDQANEGVHFLAFKSPSCVENFNQLGERFRRQLEVVIKSASWADSDFKKDVSAIHRELESNFACFKERYFARERITTREKEEFHERLHLQFDEIRKLCSTFENTYIALHDKEYRTIRKLTKTTIATMIGGAVFIFIVSGFLGILIAGNISRPIVKLRNMARQIGKGDLNARIDLHTGDETEDLAFEFNQMAEKLSASYSTLEQEVAERTRELETERSRLAMLVAGISATGTPVIVIGKDCRIEFLNSTAAETFGDCVGEFCYKMLHDISSVCAHCRLQKVIKDRETVQYEALEYKDRIYRVWAAPMKDPKGEMACIEVLQDITENKRTEKALRDTNELLEKIFSITHVLISYMDTDFNFIRVNRAYAEADGREPEFFAGKNHFELYPNEENKSIFSRVIESGESYSVYAKPFEYADHPERGVTYWDWSLHPVRDDSGKVKGLVLCLVNVTERKRVEEELRDLYKELENKNKEMVDLSKRLLFLQEWDRQQLSMELHDQIGQTLTIIKMDVEIVANSISPAYPVLKEKMKRIERALSHGIREVKDICHRLRPSTLDTMGLIPSLTVLIEEVEDRGNLKIEFYTNDNIPLRFDPDIEIAVYRIVQEALTNIIKYAAAERVFINLIFREPFISLSIEDDGVGFDVEDTLKGTGNKGRGLGLLIMKERVEQLKGDFSIESSPEHGTHILAEIPLST